MNLFAKHFRKTAPLAACLAVALAFSMTGCGAKSLADKPLAEVLPPAAPAEAGLSPATVAAIHAHVDQGIADGIYPGGVLMIARDGHLVDTYVAGNKATEPTAVPMTEDTIFELASVSKVVGTATMTMLLIEDGLLSPGTPVAEIIPTFAQNEKGSVTVADLLTHRSGLKPYESWKTAEERRTEGETQADALINQIARLEKQYPDGEYVNYSCLNYLTLARLNEIVAKESQESFLRRRVWEPLGMADTTYLVTEDQRLRVAPTFRGTFPEGRVVGSTHDPLGHYYGSTGEHCPGNSGLLSTAADLARYTQMILNGGELDGVRVMAPETVETMTTIHASLPDYPVRDDSPNMQYRAYGWNIYGSEDYPWGHPAAPEGALGGHTGYTGTLIWFDKNTDTFVVFLTNSVYTQDPPQTSTVRRKITGEILDATYGKPSEETKTAASGG